MTTWNITGEYMETCNCSFLCPCITANLAAQPTEGDCKAAITLRVDKGQHHGIELDGLSFIVMLFFPGVMGAGNGTVGLIIDDRASDEQVKAISAIASGQAGGPMAALAPLVGRMAGIERRPISFEIDGLKRSVRVGELVEQACEGVPSATAPGQAICIDNTVHPVSSRLALAKALVSRFNVFGVKWDDASGTRNGHFAPFAWSG